MSEAKDRRICPRGSEQVEARMYATVHSLGGEIAIPEPRDPQIDALIKIGSGLSKVALWRMLEMDFRFVNFTEMKMNPQLKIASEQMLKNHSKGDRQ